jgi:hypothetical protein
VVDHLNASEEFLGGLGLDEFADIPVERRQCPPMAREETEPNGPARITLPEAVEFNGWVIGRHSATPCEQAGPFVVSRVFCETYCVA